MKLADYLKEKQLTSAEFAAQVGVDRTTVGRWLGPSADGKIVRPAWDQMARIAAATSGAVMPNDFMDDLPELIEGWDMQDDSDDEPAFLAPARAGDSALGDDQPPKRRLA